MFVHHRNVKNWGGGGEEKEEKKSKITSKQKMCERRKIKFLNGQ